MRALLLASHPVPTMAVTLLAVGLAIAWGREPAGVLLVALTVVTGQLSIGWCDDATDATKDQGRMDKPVAAGALRPRAVRRAAVGMLAVSVLLSVANGWPGVLHLLVLVSGWAYALWLERTVLSLVPYLVAFGALPAYVHLGTVGRPEWWLVVVGALLGSSAHFANVLPDIERDREAGVLGLPQRMGGRASRWIAPLPAALGTVVLVFAVELPAVVAIAAGAVALAAVATPRRGRLTFLAVLAVAALDVVLLALVG